VRGIDEVNQESIDGINHCYPNNQLALSIGASYPCKEFPITNHSTEEEQMSLINTAIKPFKAQAYKDGQFIEVTDASLKGKWSVVVFYPADFTFVCPTELEDLADHYAEFQKLGVEVYGVSTDTHFAHKAWHDTSDAIKKVKYTLVGDPTGTLTRNFDVMIEEEGLALRGTFVINPEGVIKLCEIHDNGIGRDASELLRKVRAAQYVASHPGEVCPAKWKEGAATLKPSLDLVGKI
jgi:peroxiredoxin (alkyl hydroperoxide reductase subunit C)